MAKKDGAEDKIGANQTDEVNTRRFNDQARDERQRERERNKGADASSTMDAPAQSCSTICESILAQEDLEVMDPIGFGMTGMVYQAV